MTKKFLNSKKSYEESSFIIIPCPHEKTTSYGKGTKNGPSAIIDASDYLEHFDVELGYETIDKFGVYTYRATNFFKLSKVVSKVIKDNKIPVILGGEHSLSIEPIKAAKKIFPKLSVLHFDAHADLRDSYEGNKNSHACITRRVLEICPAVQVGVRSISKEEWDFAKSSKQIDRIYFMDKIDIKKILSQLNKDVYITFDIDVLDPSIMPSTGTPEPGGLVWEETLKILRSVCKNKNIVGMDFVELMPIRGLHAPDFMVAKLIYKVMGYIGKNVQCPISNYQ